MPVVAPPGVPADEFEAIVASNLRGVDIPFADDDTASPARKRMRDFIRRSQRGVTPKMVVDLLAAEKMPVVRQTVQRWLNEDAVARLVEQSGKFGQWKWRGGL